MSWCCTFRGRYMKASVSAAILHSFIDIVLSLIFLQSTPSHEITLVLATGDPVFSWRDNNTKQLTYPVQNNCSCRVTHLHWGQMERGGKEVARDVGQQTSVLEGWLVRARLWPPPPPPPWVPSVLPASMSPLGFLMDSDSNGWPPTPKPPPPLIHTPLPPAHCPALLHCGSALTTVTSLRKWSSCGSAQNFLEWWGGRMS